MDTVSVIEWANANYDEFPSIETAPSAALKRRRKLLASFI